MRRPKVSVCIPVYNGEKYIEKTVKSVLEQSFTDFELIIVDDQSADRTEEILNSFSDNRIRLLKNEKNIGMVANWNRCLDNAKGEYIKILCHDDYLVKNCLEKKVAILDADKEIGLVFNSTYIVNEHDKVIFKRRPFKSERLFDGKYIGRKSFIQKNIYGEPSNVMFRRDISEKIGHFDNNLCYEIDWDYWIKITSVRSVYYIDDYLMYFRVSKTSATSNLLKNKEALKLDDDKFIQNCLANEGLNLTKLDVLFHKINISLRTFAREVIFNINNKSNIEDVRYDLEMIKI